MLQEVWKETMVDPILWFLIKLVVLTLLLGLQKIMLHLLARIHTSLTLLWIFTLLHTMVNPIQRNSLKPFLPHFQTIVTKRMILTSKDFKIARTFAILLQGEQISPCAQERSPFLIFQLEFTLFNGTGLLIVLLISTPRAGK